MGVAFHRRDPKFAGSQDLPTFPYAQYARMLGLHGVRVEKPEEIAAAWDGALSADRPMLLEMVTDPTVPPAPPHITAKQMRHYLSALLHGDPQALQVVKTSTTSERPRHVGMRTCMVRGRTARLGWFAVVRPSMLLRLQ